LDEADVKDLLGNSQGSAVALALAPAPKPAASGVVLGTSTSIGAGTSTLPSAHASIFPSSSNGPVLGVGGGGASSQVQAAAADDTADNTTAADDDTTASSTVDIDDTASSTPDTSDASTTADISQDTNASSTPAADNASTTPESTPSTNVGSIIASQEDSSGAPSHYWHSDGNTGTYLVLDPNDGNPGYSIGNIATASTTVIGIHIKAQFNTNGLYNRLPRVPVLEDEAPNNDNSYACADLGYYGYASPTAADAMARTNPLLYPDFNGKMIDMYFQCGLGNGHDQVFPNISYRLYFYPVSTGDVSDVYVAMDAAGDKPFYEISSDGTY
jgi:hypothetical protein